MSDIDTIISEDEGKVIKVNGENIKVGKIKTITYFKLAKFLSRIFAKYGTKLKDYKSSESNIQDVYNFLEVLDEQDGLELISVLINKDKEFCKDIDGETFLDIIDIICQYNDFEKLSKKVQRVVKKFEPKKTSS